MQLSPRKTASAGFTLVELLVAVAVLVLMVVMVSQLVSSTAAVTTADEQRLDATAEARQIFDRMAHDFQAMIRRPDVDNTAYPYFNYSDNFDRNMWKRTGPSGGANDSFFWFAEADGYTSGQNSNKTGNYSTVAEVGYRIWDQNYVGGSTTGWNVARTPIYSMERSGGKQGWGSSSDASGFVFLTFDEDGEVDTGSTLIGQNTGSPHRSKESRAGYPIGPQAFRLEFALLMKEEQSDGTYFLPDGEDVDPKKGFKDVAAVVATIAILDDKTRIKIPEAEFYSTMQDLENLLVDGSTADVAAEWNDAILDPNSNIPDYVRSNVRVYQRYFYFD